MEDISFSGAVCGLIFITILTTILFINEKYNDVKWVLFIFGISPQFSYYLHIVLKHT